MEVKKKVYVTIEADGEERTYAEYSTFVGLGIRKINGSQADMQLIGIGHFDPASVLHILEGIKKTREKIITEAIGDFKEKDVDEEIIEILKRKV